MTVTNDIGGRLRQAREQRGWSIDDLARRTKLTTPVVRAIERNDFANLPGGMFRKAYVRTLAAEVGLNASDIAADYCARFEPPVEPSGIPDPVIARQEDRWIEELAPSPRRFLVAVILVSLVIAWFMLQSAFRSEGSGSSAAVEAHPYGGPTDRDVSVTSGRP